MSSLSISSLRLHTCTRLALDCSIRAEPRRFWAAAALACALAACDSRTLVAFEAGGSSSSTAGAIGTAGASSSTAGSSGTGGSSSSTGTCLISGEPCQKNADCCTGACANSGTGVLTCQPLDGCLPAGELCSGSDCCSGGPNCVFDPDYGHGRCQLANGCRLPGELCQMDSDCCGPKMNMGGPGAPPGECNATSTGVSRCVTNSIGPAPTQSGACQFSDQCTGGQALYCLPNPSVQTSGGPAFQCGNCAQEQSPCNGPRDCCGKLTCLNAVCTQSDCGNQLGATCNQPSDCCSGHCVPLLGTNATTCQTP